MGGGWGGMGGGWGGMGGRMGGGGGRELRTNNHQRGEEVLPTASWYRGH